MNYRRLGKTELMVSEIGFGAEWMERKTPEEVAAVTRRFAQAGVNVLDCWMPEPAVRSNLGAAIAGERNRWIIQGHIGSTWQDGQYVRTRDMSRVKPAFEDLLERLGTDHVELGMIHYVDSLAEFDGIMQGDFMVYVEELKAAGAIEHVGLSTHSPAVARAAALSGRIEAVMFSANPAFDMMPASSSLDALLAFSGGRLENIETERAELYTLCERKDVGLTVMKGYAGGRLLSAKTSPFGVALTPVQCIHYALTRPAVASIMVGAETVAHVDDALAYETADDAQRDYAAALANASLDSPFGQCTYCGHCAPCAVRIDIALVNKFYDLAVMQPGVPASVRAHYEALETTAQSCIACQTCEPRCPFGVDIAERMKKAAALFGC